MKKTLFCFICLLCIASFSWAMPPGGSGIKAPSTISNGQTITYNAATGQFEAADLSGGGDIEGVGDCATGTCNKFTVTGAITATGGFVGALTGNVTGNVTGNCSGSAGTVTTVSAANLDNVWSSNGLLRRTGAATYSVLGLGTLTDTYLCTYSTASGFVCNTNPATYQAALTYPVTGIASPTAGYLTKWGASGNTLADGPKIGTFTDAKWCSYSTAGGLACTENAPAGSGDITGVGDCATGQCDTFTVTGNITAAGFATTKVSGTAGDMGLYEANSTDTDTAGFRGPTALTANTSYRGQLPTARPTSDNSVMIWGGTAGSGDGTPATPYIHAITWADLDDYVTKALYDAYSILYADSDNTPAALTVGASTLVGRKSSGGIAALTASEALSQIGAQAAPNEIDGSAAATLTAAQMTANCTTTNYGQAASDVAITLPTAAANLSCLFVVGTAQSNKWGARAGTNDKIYLVAADGTVSAGSDNGYARMTAAQVGQSFACWSFKTGSSTYDWQCKAIAIGTSTFAAN